MRVALTNRDGDTVYRTIACDDGVVKWQELAKLITEMTLGGGEFYDGDSITVAEIAD